jgi:hypothetical protein
MPDSERHYTLGACASQQARRENTNQAFIPGWRLKYCENEKFCVSVGHDRSRQVAAGFGTHYPTLKGSKDGSLYPDSWLESFDLIRHWIVAANLNVITVLPQQQAPKQRRLSGAIIS